MRKALIIPAALIVVLIVAMALWTRYGANKPVSGGSGTSVMQITSPDFADGERIPRLNTCDAQDVSPELHFSGVPSDAQSLALIMEDPDAPTGTWTHWTEWNMRPDVPGIPHASSPDHGIEGVTSFGRSGYGGPCPPSGTHRYYFHLFALDTELDLGPTADAVALRKAMTGHVLGEATLMGTYSREP